jgi:hypothetical protein
LSLEAVLAAAFPDHGHRLPLPAVCKMTFPARGLAVRALPQDWHRHPNSFERSTRAILPPKNLDGCNLQQLAGRTEDQMPSAADSAETDDTIDLQLTGRNRGEDNALSPMRLIG